MRPDVILKIAQFPSKVAPEIGTAPFYSKSAVFKIAQKVSYLYVIISQKWLGQQGSRGYMIRLTIEWL